MNEEIKTEEVKTEVVLSPHEEKALEQGWVPQEQWQGDPEQWRPAKEFLDRGELFKKIEDQNRTIKEFKKTLEDFKGHHEKVRETEYARALKQLKEQKITALEEGDAAKVIKLDDEIDLVRDEQAKLKQAPAQTTPEIDPQFTAWVDQNKWYNTDDIMRAAADALGTRYARQGHTPQEVLHEVAKQMRMEFPHKFRNPNKDKPGAVEGSVQRGAATKDTYVLSQEERQIMNRFINKIPGYTEAKYVEELKKIKSRGA